VEGFTTPFGRLREVPPEVETAAGKEPALLVVKVASSKIGILSTSVDLHSYVSLLINEIATDMEKLYEINNEINKVK